MSVSINQLRDMSSLFMRSEVNRWLKSDFESIDTKLKRYNLLEKNKGKTYLQVLRKVYKAIALHYPNEYVVKNEFISQKIKELLGTEKSVVFNEFRVGKAIADLALFNGDSKVFEIKTILDSEYRLSSQLEEYKKIFNYVYIIVPIEHLHRYEEYDIEVGVITYNQMLNEFEERREAKRNFKMDVDVLMEVLHSKEYMEIIADNFELPKGINAFNQFDISKKLLSHLSSDRLDKIFVETIKNRNVNNLFFNKINSEFNQVCLSMNLKKEQRDDMISKLRRRIT